MPDYQDLLYDVSDGLAQVTINRPEAANSLTRTTVQELCDVSIRCDTDPGVRAVLLTGAGDRMFCAGADLKAATADLDQMNVFVKEMTIFLHAAVSRFARMRAPLVTAVKGTAAGGGFSLALGGDLVLAGESSVFTSAYTASGLSPDGSSTYFLPRLVGLRRAQELFLTNRRLSAAEALGWGIVTRVLPDDEVKDAALELARQLAAGPTLAYGSVKRLLATSFTTELETQMEHEAQQFGAIGGSADLREGVTAFVERRTPRFEGR